MSIICCIFVSRKRNTLMSNIIHNPRVWEHMDEESSFNRHYYRNPQTGEIIIEEYYDFCDFGSFHNVNENLEKGEYLGRCYLCDYNWDQEKDIELE